MAEKRIKNININFWVTEEEKKIIDESSLLTGLSRSDYLRSVALGHELKSAVDKERIQDMLRVNGDLGRLGGLIKYWLKSKEHRDFARKERIEKTLYLLVERINLNMDLISSIAEGFVDELTDKRRNP